jgi:heme exporter protein A
MRLVVQELACERGGRLLFQGLSFALSPGEALRISGPNGAGKTSLLRLIAGLIPPAAGRAALEGLDGPLGEAAHFFSHHDAVKGTLTVAENLGFWRAVLGGGGAAIESALAVLGLGDLSGLPARVLSAGQRRRLALARLLVVPRPLWLLDEPAANLDAAGQATLARLINDHLTSGGIAAVAAHGAPEFSAVREIRLGGGTP